MAYARFRRRGHQVPPPIRMILYGLEAAQDLTTTIQDLRRTVRLMQSGFVTLFPDEASGIHLLYCTLDRDLMQVERTCQCITLQLLTALAETHEDIVQLAAFSCPATRGVWINGLYLVPTGRGPLTDESGRLPVPLDAHPFRVVVRTVQITASLGGFIDPIALAVPLSALVDIAFVLLRVNRPPCLRTWTEAADEIDTVVRPVSQDTLLRDVVRAIQPIVRIQVLIQDPPSAVVSDSTRELLFPSVVLL
jgi:hypothetical protein